MIPGRKATGLVTPGPARDHAMASTLRILTYFAYGVHVAAATWGIVQLHGHIGSAFSSAAPFYFAWILTPLIVAHFGLKKWGKDPRAGWALFGGGVVVMLITIALMRAHFLTDHLGPMAMLIYIPFPITEVLVVSVSLAIARKLYGSQPGEQRQSTHPPTGLQSL